MDKKNESRKAIRAARLRKQRTRRAIMTLCLMLAVAVVSVGGTIAWLTATTGSVVNTFTAGDINITLKEHDYDPDTNTLSNSSLVEANADYQIIPGRNLPKDPFVTVEGGSEACWLFVKVEQNSNWNTKMTYSVADGWTALDGVSGVYYREVTASANDQTFGVLTNDMVYVSSELTETECEAMETNKPTLTFTAYAVQKEGVDDAVTAWGKVPTTNN